VKKINLKDLSLAEMENLTRECGEKPFRARQVYEWIFQKDICNIHEMTNLPLKLRDSLNKIAYLSHLTIANKRISKDGTIKYLFELEDGNGVEGVLISDRKRLTLCISSQVGCKLNCSFCLTGKGGFVRNLRHSEIIEQILSVRREIKSSQHAHNSEAGDITNVVLMGMGEPLDNYENVIKSIKTMVSPYGLKIPARRITLSTSGLIPEITRLGNENLKIKLAVSLNASDNETRDKIMPVNRNYPLERLMKTLKEYPLPRGSRITIEYVMIKGINDSLEDARRLSIILRGLKCKINLIPLNPPFIKGGRGTHPVDGSGDFEPPPYKRVEEFQNLLISKHYTALVRKSKGADIYATCGQLRGEFRIQKPEVRIKTLSTDPFLYSVFSHLIL
jgi:23S rRNA (adenine2503-C2)-methyltransferase